MALTQGLPPGWQVHLSTVVPPGECCCGETRALMDMLSPWWASTREGRRASASSGAEFQGSPAECGQSPPGPWGSFTHLLKDPPPGLALGTLRPQSRPIQAGHFVSCERIGLCTVPPATSLAGSPHPTPGPHTHTTTWPRACF